MNSLLAKVKHIVASAAHIARAQADIISKSVPVAFDGDAWVWAWSDFSGDKSVAEVLLRVRPDVLEEGIQIEISGPAWLPEDRQVSASRVYFGRYCPADKLPSAQELAVELVRAWQGAASIRFDLPKIRKTHHDLIQKLQDKGLLGR